MTLSITNDCLSRQGDFLDSMWEAEDRRLEVGGWRLSTCVSKLTDLRVVRLE